MIESGIFDENDQIELLNGVIIEKMPKRNKTREYQRYCRRPLDNWIRSKSLREKPKSGLARWIFRTRTGYSFGSPAVWKIFWSHPTPEEILLILEVADTTLGYDRNTKSAAYARAGIRQYILLNVQEKTLEDYRESGADGFQSKQTYRSGQSFNLVAFPEVSFQVKDFLPLEKA